MKILIIDDDELARINLSHMLSSLLEKQDEIIEAEGQSSAITQLNKTQVDLCFIDLDLERELAGLEIIKIAKQHKSYPIVLSGREESDVVTVAYENGCEDFLSKPISKDGLSLILQKFYFAQKYKNLKGLIFEHYITQDDYIVGQLESIDEMILSRLPVLLRGPSGTGKTAMAKIIHQAIIGEKGDFIHLNCAEIPEHLVESELFGYVKGAFTGADGNKEGLLSLANHGTLFLDEVGAMPLRTQQKLLKAIEEKKFYPLGSEKVVKSDFRLIAATCDDLEDKVESKEFREDFLFRLSGHKIVLPPLKERKGDIPLLLDYFLKSSSRRIVLNSKAYSLLENYDWPGNVRELRFVVSMLQAKNRGIITDKDILGLLGIKKLEEDKSEGNTKIVYSFDEKIIDDVKQNGLKFVIDDLERKIVQHFYTCNEQRVRSTIKELQISTNRFYKIMKNGEEA